MCFGKIPVAFVVRGNRHNRARSVAHEHVVGNPHGNAVAVERIDGVATRENAGFFLRQIRAFQVGFVARFFDVGFDFGAFFRCREAFPQRMFRCDNHVGYAVKRVRARGENFELRRGIIGERELNFRAFAATDPVFLQTLRGIRPVQSIQARDEFFRISGDFQNPLANRAALNGEVPAFAARTFVGVEHFFVGEHGAELRAEPHRFVVNVSQAVLEKIEENPLRPLKIF